MKKKKNILILISIFTFLIGICLIIFNIKNANNILYTSYKKANYEVILKDNNFYNTNNSLEFYPSNGIDTININFNYKLKSNTKLNYYYVISTYIKGNSKDSNEEIWEYIDNKNISKSSLINNDLSLNKNIFINYDYFNNLARGYEKNYGISINADLIINLTVYINNNIKDSIELTIPLNNNITYINKNFQEKNIFKNNSSHIYNTIGITSIIISFLITLFLLKRKILSNINLLDKKLNIFLKDYNYLIISTKDKPNIENLSIIKLLNLKDLLNIAIQNNTNIIYYHHNNIHNFFIIINKFVYTYDYISNN